MGGTFQVITGGSHGERSTVLRALRAAAEGTGFLTLELRAEPVDRHAPYGVVQDLIALLKPAIPEGEGMASPLAGLMAMAVVGVSSRERSGARSVSSPRPSRRTPPDTVGSETLPRPEEVRAEVFELVRTRTTKTPLAVTLEPGEFVDPPSLSFFAQLARELPRLPLVIAVSLREEEREAFNAWKEALASTSASFTRLQEDPSRPTPRQEIRHRLEGLPPESRRVAAAIGAAGPDGTLPVLQLVLGRPAALLEDQLAPAVAAGIFWREGSRYHLYEPGWRPELERSLNPAELRALHGSIARALRIAHPVLSGKLLFRVAAHWEESGLVEEAVPAILAASQEAIRRGAHEEAERELHRALVMAQGMPSGEGRELEERTMASLALAQEMQGKSREALESYDRAIRAAREQHHGIDRWGPYLTKYARIATAQAGAANAVDDRLEEAVVEAARQKFPSVEAELHATLAHRLLIRGQPEEGRKHATLAVERAEVRKDPPVLARSLRMMALALFTGSLSATETAEATAILRRALETIPPERAGAELAFALDDMASLACAARKEDEALMYGRRSVDLSRRHCSRGEFLLMLGNYAEHQLHAKDLPGATATLAEIRTFADRYGLPEAHAVRQQWMLSEALRRQLAGDEAGGRKLLEETAALGEKIGARDIMGQALVYLVVSSVERGDYESARTHLRRIEKEGLKRALFSMTRELLESAVKKIPAKRS